MNHRQHVRQKDPCLRCFFKREFIYHKVLVDLNVLKKIQYPSAKYLFSQGHLMFIVAFSVDFETASVEVYSESAALNIHRVFFLVNNLEGIEITDYKNNNIILDQHLLSPEVT